MHHRGIGTVEVAVDRKAVGRSPLSITKSRSSLRLTSIESVMPSSHLILCRHLLLLPPIPPSIRVFSPTPQFKSMNSSARSFLHSPTFTSIHDHRKNHSLYYMAQWFVESKTEYFKYTKSSPVLIKISRGTLLELNKAVLKFTCKNKCISILMKTLTK